LDRIEFQDLSCSDPLERELYHEILSDLLDTGEFLNGKHTRKFIDDFKNFTKLDCVIPVGNGTNALEIILKRLKQMGLEMVACAANAGGYASVAARLNNMHVSYVDIDSLTGLITVEQLENSYKENRFEILVYTHLYGNGQDLIEIIEFCEKNEIVLVEDCAQAMGLRIKGIHVGNFGEYAAFSFFPTKNLGAFGDAGAIACSKYERPFIQSITQYGWREKYNIEIDLGTNSRMDEIQAAVLSRRIEKLDIQNLERNRIIQKYRAAIPVEIGNMIITSNSVAHLAVLFCRNRDSVMRNLSDNQIPFSIHYPIPDHRQSAWRDYFSTTELPNTDKWAESVLSLPLHLNLSDEAISRICQSVSKFLKSHS
jgi:dTDP-3-amino-2,3,6-trideoxy-4-keto-D-glucose/dTDP-3-amino-3,4,6-trideoxy-alpha-D-glucose/dTDP-2,6-dideoxy-D-kanosamine transaminase